MFIVINRIENLDLPDVKTKRRIFSFHADRMTLSDDADLELIMSKVGAIYNSRL
jgi:ATP-dependent 26S proteasome regulatory subunit